MIPKSYDSDWKELNEHLAAFESMQGSLVDALLHLEVHQKRTGFIQDDLHAIRRFNYVHPVHPFRYFQVQYNPRRALRFRGSGLAEHPSGVQPLNDGCFLCRENIQWQQQGRELGYEIDALGHHYHAWMNPFPLSPCHVVISTREHLSQEWELHPSGQLSLERLIGSLVNLATRLPGFIGFYNGINAGASIPGHMHYQFCMRQEENVYFPLEQAERDFTQFDHTGIVKNYPISAAVWQGTAETVLVQAVEWIRFWADHNTAHLPQLTANLIATTDPQSGEVSLFFVPRDRNRSKSERMSGLVGGLEIMGEFVFSSEEECTAIEEGRISYDTMLEIYDDIYTPFFIDTPARLSRES